MQGINFCDFCSNHHPELEQCSCKHTFCINCAVVRCTDDMFVFSACTFCPGCPAQCGNKTQAQPSKLGAAKSIKQPPKPPSEYLCPITRELMDDPVVLIDGFSYDREHIIRWLAIRMVSPITGTPVANALMPNTVLRVLIRDWKQQHAASA